MVVIHFLSLVYTFSTEHYGAEPGRSERKPAACRALSSEAVCREYGGYICPVGLRARPETGCKRVRDDGAGG